jgi:hypothetical protein
MPGKKVNNWLLAKKICLTIVNPDMALDDYAAMWSLHCAPPVTNLFFHVRIFVFRSIFFLMISYIICYVLLIT